MAFAVSGVLIVNLSLFLILLSLVTEHGYVKPARTWAGYAGLATDEGVGLGNEHCASAHLQGSMHRPGSRLFGGLPQPPMAPRLATDMGAAQPSQSKLISGRRLPRAAVLALALRDR